MRIAQICPYSLSVPGGVQSQVLGLARALRDLGHEARVLAPCDGPPPDPMVTPLGKSVPTAVNGSIAPIAPDPACALRTLHALRNENFDVLHLHEPLSPGPTLTALVASDIPIVGTFHAFGSSTMYDKSLGWLGKRIARKLKIRVAVSEDARSTAMRHMPGRYEILFNGIEIERFADAVPYEKTKPTVVFIGRHEPRKGLSTLIDAMSLIDDDIELWVIGHGPQTPELRLRASHDPRIHWLGRVTDNEKRARLKAADVFCAPSINGESFGIVLLEAMAAGVPIVASRIDGYSAVTRDGADACLVPPGDAKELAVALRSVLNNDVESKRLVDAGRARADEFSMRTLADAYLPLYERAMGRYPFDL